MNLNVKVIPNSKKVNVIQEGNLFKVYVKAQAIDNKANKALIDVLSEFLNLKKIFIKIIKGQKSRNKIVEVKQVAKTSN